jgi:hypothetical protein
MSAIESNQSRINGAKSPSAMNALKQDRDAKSAPAPKTSKTEAEDNIFLQPDSSKKAHKSLKNKPLTSQ